MLHHLMSPQSQNDVELLLDYRLTAIVLCAIT